MKSNIFIPKKINVGFQERSDTYTSKLAYIIYFDQKGVLRKETSWQGWRDEKIPNQIFNNTPVSGFVLNKKAGGYDTGWNHRQTYCRIYDPRDFEFEITIPNLLYILENTNSIKGKGLEGEFVYGWDGKDLILIPVDSPDYKEISEFSTIIHTKNYVKVKDLILGATYRTKDNQEYIYMGRFDYWDTKHEYGTNKYGSRDYNNYTVEDINKGKHHYFVKKIIGWDKNSHLSTMKLKSLGDKFIECISTECVENYVDLFDKLECTTDYSPYDKSKDEYELRTLEDFETQIKENRWHSGKFYGNIDGQFEKLEIGKYSDLTDEELNKKDGYYVRMNDQANYKYEGDYWSNRKYIFIEPLFSGTIEEIYNQFQPSFKCRYLKNNKLYGKDKN